MRLIHVVPPFLGHSSSSPCPCMASTPDVIQTRQRYHCWLVFMQWGTQVPGEPPSPRGIARLHEQPQCRAGRCLHLATWDASGLYCRKQKLHERCFLIVACLLGVLPFLAHTALLGAAGEGGQLSAGRTHIFANVGEVLSKSPDVAWQQRCPCRCGTHHRFSLADWRLLESQQICLLSHLIL